MFRNWAPLVIALLMAVIFAVMGVNPPAPKDLNTPANQFSSARAMTDVRIIAAKPHPTGSEENANVRTYLSRRLIELGAEVSVSKAQLGERSLARLNKWSGANNSEQDIFNVIGVLPGKDPKKPAILLMAHHDTVWGSPGAADDTIGIASILEITRALKERGVLDRDLIILFTDAEELGLVGAINFFKSHSLRDKIGAVVNFEARGGGGTANMFQTSSGNGAAAKLFARHVKNPSTSSLSIFVYNILPNDTDLTPALEKDYVAYNIANIGLAEYYHSPKIDVSALDEGTLQHMGSQGLDLTRALLSTDELPVKTADKTFFDLFGFFTIIYPPFFGWIFLALGGAFYLSSLNYSTQRKDVLIGAVKMIGFLLIGGVLLYGLNLLSGSGRGANYYDRLAAIPKLEVTAFLLCLSMLFAIFGYKNLSSNERFGAVLPIFIVAVLGQAFAPTATYFISLPILLCGIVSLAMRKWPDKKLTYAVNITVAALVSGYMLSLGHLLMLGVGPDMLSVVILPASILGVSVFPLYKGIKSRANTNIAIAAFIGSAALALWVRVDPIASTIPLY